LAISELGAELKPQDFPTCWVVLKEIIPLLEKQKARDLVRLLLTKHSSQLQALTGERSDREMAIECLGYLPSREVVENLGKLLNHKDDAVQLMASGALRNHTPRLVVPLMIEGLIAGTVCAARAGQVLLAMGFFAQEMLMDSYNEAPPQVQACFLELMVLGDNPKCLPYAEAALKAPQLFLKKKGLEATAHFSFTELWPEVVMCLAEEDWALKAKTLEILAKLKVTEALEFVQPFTADADPWVRQCAVNCIRSLQTYDYRGRCL